jgi:hypothetical protein
MNTYAAPPPDVSAPATCALAEQPPILPIRNSPIRHPETSSRPRQRSEMSLCSGFPGRGGDYTSTGYVQVYERMQNSDCKNQLCWVHTKTLASTGLGARHRTLVSANGGRPTCFDGRPLNGWWIRDLKTSICALCLNRRKKLKGDVGFRTPCTSFR